MIQFDKTQPVIHTGPRLDFGRGRYLTHSVGSVWAWVTQSGVHMKYVEAQSIVYESTLLAEWQGSR